MDDFERLAAIVDADEALQNSLLSVTDTMGFVALVKQLALDRGLVVPEGRIWQEIERGRARWYATWNP